MAQHHANKLIFNWLRMVHREISINRERTAFPICVYILLPPLLLYIKAGTGFVGELIMPMNRS